MTPSKNKKLAITLCIIFSVALTCSLLALIPDTRAQATDETERPLDVYDIFLPVVANEYPSNCEQGISNGGFEDDSDWIIPITKYTAAYTTTVSLSGERSLRTGIVDNQDNRYSYSSVRQEVSIPGDTAEAVLSFWLYPKSSETTTLRLPDNPLKVREEDAAKTSDVQLVIVLDSAGNELERLLAIRENDQIWKPYSFDLAHYSGETIQIYFGVYNNGLGGTISMFVDDISFFCCQSACGDI
jgi:hypothetical protein